MLLDLEVKKKWRRKRNIKQTDGTTHPPRRAIKRENAEKNRGRYKEGDLTCSFPLFSVAICL